MALTVSNGLPFVLLEPDDPTLTGIRFDAYDRSGQFIQSLSRASGRSWVDVLNELGGGEALVLADDPTLDPAAIEYGSYIYCWLHDRLRFTWRIENRERVLVKQGDDQPAVPGWKVSGPGRAVDLAEAQVRPEGGSGSALEPTVRLFTHATLLYDVSGWDAATELTTTFNLPDDWPSTPAVGKQVWDRDYTGPGSMPAGDVYFAEDVVVSSTTQVRLYVTADDDVHLWFAGAKVVEAEVRAFLATHTWEGTLTPGTHRLAGKAVNRAGATNNPGWLIYELWTLDEDGNPDVLLAASDAGTKVQGYPLRPPGFTRGAVVELLVGEAQARGVLPLVTLGFDGVTDAGGATWTATADEAFTVGDSLLDVLRQLSEVGMDWRMTPAGRLDCYQQYGLDRTLQTSLLGPVVLRPGRNVLSATVQGEGPKANVLLALTPYGFVERENAASVGLWGRKEAFLQLGSSPSPEHARGTLDAMLAELSGPRSFYSYEVTDVAGHRPYTDWAPGWWVLAPGQQGQLEKVRVRSLAVSEDDDGNPSFTPELASLIYELAERHQRWLAAMSRGTLTGETSRARPVDMSGGGTLGGSAATKNSRTAPQATGSGAVVANSVVSETGWGQASGAGASTKASRADHTHGSPERPTLARDGGREVINDHGNSSGPVTLDPATGNVHLATLTGDVTLSLGAALSGAVSLTVQLTQDGTGGWAVTWPTVTWLGLEPTMPADPGATLLVALWTYDAGTTWWAAPAGGGGGGGTSGHAETVGDGSATSFAIAHGLGSTDVVVATYDLSGAAPVAADAAVTVTDANTVTIDVDVAPATDELRVVVVSL